MLGPARKKQRVVQTQGNNYNLFASQLASLDSRTCENWVDINGIPIQEEKQLTSGWEDVLYSKEKPDQQNICLRDPDQFVAGGLHRNPESLGEDIGRLPPEAYNLALGSKQDWNFKLLSTPQRLS